MAKAEPERDVQVRERVDVYLSAKEVFHALRCWVDIQLVERRAVPQAKSFSDIVISVSCDDDGNLLGATATYEPEVRP